MIHSHIIGGAGFIGTTLQRLLGSGFSVSDKVTGRQGIQTIDIRKPDDLTMLPQAEWMVLLAAEHQDNVSPISLYYDVNVTGTQNVLDEMDRKGITKIIFTSSVAIYGLDKDNPTEDHPADPFNHYGKSKWQAEELLRAWHKKDPENRTLIIIRPTVVFGPGNRGNVYNLLRQIVSGKFLMIGKGENKKSLAYVENVAGFIKYLLHSSITGYRVFNYVDKPDFSMNELVQVAEKALDVKLPAVRIPYWLGYTGGMMLDVVSKITGKTLPISAVRVKKFCATTVYSGAAAKGTGYTASATLEEGLSTTIQAIKRGI